MDITFWSLDFAERKILPASSKDNGYTSMNAVIEFNGNGSFELVFYDKEIEAFAEAHPEGILISWGKFYGYATDLQFKEKEKKIFGSHLNAILHKAVFPTYNGSGDAIKVLTNIFATYAPWMTIKDTSQTAEITYNSEKYLNGDTFIQNYLATSDMGYEITIANKQLYIELLKPKNNPLILSGSNRNVYEMQLDFSLKNNAFGGWYKKTEENDGTKLDDEEWIYISTSDKDGIYVQDVVLNANSPANATEELKQHKINRELLCKTRNVEFKVDYNIGDIVRVQRNGIEQKKQITSVDLWYEGSSYHQEPTLTEWEE